MDDIYLSWSSMASAPPGLRIHQPECGREHDHCSQQGLKLYGMTGFRIGWVIAESPVGGSDDQCFRSNRFLHLDCAPIGSRAPSLECRASSRTCAWVSRTAAISLSTSCIALLASRPSPDGTFYVLPDFPLLQTGFGGTLPLPVAPKR